MAAEAQRKRRWSSIPIGLRRILAILAAISGLIVAIANLADLQPTFEWLCRNSIVCNIEPPSAAFTVSTTAGISPLRINLNNLSTGTIEKYRWDFGNGQGDDDENPNQYVYLEPGEYTITLIVEGPSGVDRHQVTIVVRSDVETSSQPVEPPTAVVTTAPSIANTPIPPTVTASPESAFRDYFTLIEQDQYSISWTLLTDRWKARFNSEGFEAYASWVMAVTRVDITDVVLVCQTADWAVIRADLDFYTGVSDTTPYQQHDRYFRLRADVSRNTWLFDDGGENPRTCSAGS